MADKLKAEQGEMLDALVFRHYGATRGLVEVVLEDSDNYRISDEPEILPMGREVVLKKRSSVTLLPTKKLFT